jgi:hypothetical protein
MSVEQRNVVDFIGTSKADGHVILTISDHLPFDGNEARLVNLQDKLNDYLAAIESGEICDAYPAANGRPIEISIRFKHSPDERGLAFLRASERAIREAGFSLTYETLHEQSTGIA